MWWFYTPQQTMVSYYIDYGWLSDTTFSKGDFNHHICIKVPSLLDEFFHEKEFTKFSWINEYLLTV